MDVPLSARRAVSIKLALMLCCVRLSSCKDGCESPLVSHLPQSAFRSSSQLSNSHSPGYAKLNRRDGAGGWSPLDSINYHWLEINLGARTEVTAVATQGRYGSADWVTHYLLMFSDTGHNWREYRQEDSIGVFLGNTNADSVVSYKLQQPVFAQFLRVLPLLWNPNGRVGLRLEAYGCQYKSEVGSFDGSSYLHYKPDSVPSPSPKELITMNFKTLHNSGVLMHMEGSHGHTVSLELLKGNLFINLSKGNFHTSESLGSLLDDQHWHHVSIERLRGHVNFTVDKSTLQLQLPEHQSRFQINEISLGGVSSDWPHSENPRRNFHGCLENVQYNGIDVIDLAKSQQLSVVGNVTFTCLETVDVPVTFSSSESFLQLPWIPTHDAMSVGLQFRTWNEAGLLLTFDLHHQAGTLWVYLSEARARMQVHKAGRVIADLTAGSGLNDGQWHTVDFSFRRGRLILAVDKSDMSTITTSFPIMPVNWIFFGGCPITDDGCKNPFSSFQGCVRLVHLDEGPVDLIKAQQMLIGNFNNLQMDMCGIVDRCSPSHCEHGGKCSQSWSSFHCDCSDTGYRGATCHSSVYEASCEGYKHRGNTSGLYHIDVDGSGPLKPQLVYCDMSDKAWTVIRHNNTELTKVQPSSESARHLASFNYSADNEQLAAIITQAERCEQELSYRCKNSRLLNTPDGTPFTWWVGRSGDAHTYWAGAPPGTQQCACAVRGDCVDPEHFCNCDRDLDDWMNDSGVLSHKEHLPLRLLAVGDVSRPGSEAAYRVGPLRCYGDDDFWNAARFEKETSYLHFPTFHGELSADISFFFKTSSSSGVFLENLGIKDFIRVELSLPDEVTFSFDVGDGPSEVRVKTPVLLNDERWHRVVAERNVKEASLSVDGYPGSVRKAPAEGHVRLRLNSQLFVGGTASRQKGFLGCVRSLRLNGKALDLEGRAEITPGVRPGCPGHCGSYGHLCRNQGRCLDEREGFACDCAASPYSGTFCHKEVSAFFRPGTSVTYDFEEPNGNAGGSSDQTAKGENVSLSFRTGQVPGVLLYASSYGPEFLSIFLDRNGRLEVNYKLQRDQDADAFRSSVSNLADGLPHSVLITRVLSFVSVQIDHNMPEEFNVSSDAEFDGFKSVILGTLTDDRMDAEISTHSYTGCLSVVRFNSVSPLKAALLRGGGPVTVRGTLSQSPCSSGPYAAETTHSLSENVGSVGRPVVDAYARNSALIGGVIAVVIFVILACLAVMARLVYRRKDALRTHESKGGKSEGGRETPLSADLGERSIVSDGHKEYFI